MPIFGDDHRFFFIVASVGNDRYYSFGWASSIWEEIRFRMYEDAMSHTIYLWAQINCTLIAWKKLASCLNLFIRSYFCPAVQWLHFYLKAPQPASIFLDVYLVLVFPCGYMYILYTYSNSYVFKLEYLLCDNTNVILWY